MNAVPHPDPLPSLVSADPPSFRWTPFDTAWGTIASGILLTLALAGLLRVLSV
jgi:hypothetical protein